MCQIMHEFSLLESIICRANRLLFDRKVHDAIYEFRKADGLRADPVNCAAGLWTCYMLSGQFELAWNESARIQSLGYRDHYTLWDGRPISGGRVLVRAVHGLGDTIQFVRYARLLKERCAVAMVQTHPELVDLVKTVSGVDSAITWPDSVDVGASIDQVVEIMELPRIFGTTTASIPNTTPYISVSKANLERSARQLGAKRRPKVGFLWASSDYDPARSVPLDALMPVVKSGRYELFSFQRGPRAEELRSVPGFDNVVEIDSAAGSMDTAAYMAHMDALLTVDTFPAHLAGALGRPVLLMLPYRADWRWMLDRSDSPWYPTMRLFRQSAPECWDPVIRDVTAELNQMF